MSNTHLLIIKLDHQGENPSFMDPQPGSLLRMMGLNSKETELALEALKADRMIVICNFLGSADESDRIPLLVSVPFQGTTSIIVDKMTKDIESYNVKIKSHGLTLNKKTRAEDDEIRVNLSKRVTKYWVPLLQAARAIENSEPNERFVVLGRAFGRDTSMDSDIA